MEEHFLELELRVASLETALKEFEQTFVRHIHIQRTIHNEITGFLEDNFSKYHCYKTNSTF